MLGGRVGDIEAVKDSHIHETIGFQNFLFF